MVDLSWPLAGASLVVAIGITATCVSMLAVDVLAARGKQGNDEEEPR